MGEAAWLGSAMAAQRGSWWAYPLWAFTGVVLGFGVASLPSIGVFLLWLAALLALIGFALPGGRTTAAFLVVAGLGAAPLFIARHNMGGPGTVCHPQPNPSYCAELRDPWPFLVAGVVLVVLGVGLAWWFGRGGRRAVRTTTEPATPARR